MHSVRTKFTLLTAIALLIAMGTAMLISVISIKKLGREDADRLLHLQCETGAMNLESYFQSVENSVKTVALLVQNSLEERPPEELGAQVEQARRLFDGIAYNTNGVLTYYFRIDPEVSETVKGFWYVDTDGEGFREHEVTDITLYDTADTNALVWFTIPKATGEGVWLAPYITDNLGARVISYNEPVYREERFIGVIGIEIDYGTLAYEAEKIRPYESGYAFILDENGNTVYHPEQDPAAPEGENTAVTSPEEILGEQHVRYHFGGIGKEAVWRPLSNGMRLYVAVPLSEINSGWQNMIGKILAASLVLLALVILVTMRFAARLTQPLLALTRAAEQVERGSYDFSLEYDGNDEVGILTRTFLGLAAHMKDHISSLSRKVYVDALTSVRNKGAYADHIQKLQDRMDEGREEPVFGFAVFDCDNLKHINDTFGHDRGDEYLKAASRLICRVFKHSPVFRIGGDEFAVILEGEDFERREELSREFEKSRKEICEKAENGWEQVNVAFGTAVYDPENDPAVIDVARRADRLMYEDKRRRKEGRAQAGKPGSAGPERSL